MFVSIVSKDYSVLRFDEKSLSVPGSFRSNAKFAYKLQQLLGHFGWDIVIVSYLANWLQYIVCGSVLLNIVAIHMM